MNNISMDELTRIFNTAGEATSAKRSIVPYYRTRETDTEINTFIFTKVVQHFRENDRPDGVYRLGHELELVLGKRAK